MIRSYAGKEGFMENNQVLTAEERKLGSEKMGKLFTSYLIACLAGYISQMLTVVADGIFVGNGTGAMGFAAIGIVSPFWTLLLAVQLLIAVGGSSIAAIYLGEGNEEAARKTFGQSFWYGTFLSVIITLIVMLNLKPILTFVGAKDPEVLAGAVEYMNCFMPFFPLMVLGGVLFYFVRVDEKPFYGTIVYVAPVPVCIFVEWLILIKLRAGIVGSAAGYVICVATPFLLIVYFLFSKKTKFKIKLSDMKLDFKLIGRINKLGAASFIVQITLTVFAFVINMLLAKYGNSMDVAVFGLINGYVLYILTNISNGFVASVQPISSFNYGARIYSRVRQIVLLGMKSIFATMAILLILLAIFSDQVLGYFAAGDLALVEASKHAILLFMFLYPVGGITVVIAGYFQSIDSNVKAVINSIGRSFIFAVPLAFIMSAIMGVDGVWLSFPVSEAIAGAIAIAMIAKELKRLKGLEENRLQDR